jgi:outer membrane protein assembly factor BamB
VPTVQAEVVYGSSGFGHVYCVDRSSGKERWALDVAKVFGAQPPRFGYAVHPVIHGDLCILAPIGDAVGVAAVSSKDGKTVWKAKTVGESQSSPLLVKLLGREMIVMPGAKDGALIIAGLDPKDGKILFEYTEEIGRGIFNAIPNLTVVNTDTAFYTGGYGKGTRVLKFTEEDGKIGVAKAGSLGAGATIHPPLVVGEQIYITAGSGMGGGGGRFGRGRDRGRGGPEGGRPGGEPQGQRDGGDRPERPPGGPGGRPPGGGGGGGGESGLVCMDLSGKVLWATGSSPAFGGGSIINAGGVIVSQDGGDGTLRLVKPGPGYQEMASGKVFSKEPGRELWAPMALASGKLVMRSQAQLVCVDLSAEAATE